MRKKAFKITKRTLFIFKKVQILTESDTTDPTTTMVVTTTVTGQ